MVNPNYDGDEYVLAVICKGFSLVFMMRSLIKRLPDNNKINHASIYSMKILIFEQTFIPKCPNFWEVGRVDRKLFVQIYLCPY